MPEVQNRLKTEDYFLNVGPQHPSTHGVLRLLVKLDGEVIEGIEPDLGYIHRSIEKMCESQTYRQFIHLTSRMDYLSAHINNQACALAIENALGVEAPPKARALRVILAELTRLASHQLWWGVFGMDLGALSPFFYGFRDREMITEIFEETCGSRLTMNYIVPGGVMYNINPEFPGKVKKLVKKLKENLHEYDRLLTENSIFRERSERIGYISPGEAVNYSCSGPVARGSGVSCDIRKLHPYDGYDLLDFDEVTRTGGDVYARYKVRVEEMRQSLKIIDQLIDNIPGGEHQAKTKKMIKLPKGEFYQRVETARGEFGVYLVSNGGRTPYRIKFRSPGFSNLAALDHIAGGDKIADLVAIMASLDLVIPDIDR